MAVDQICNKARAKHEAKQYGEAIKLYQMVLMKRPGDLDANYLLGTLYAETGKLQESKKYLLKAEKIMPGSPFIKVNLGNVYKEEGYFDAAINCYIHALEIQPDLAEAWLNLDVVSKMVEKKSEKSGVCCLEFGLSCIQEGRNDAASAIMSIGHALDPDNVHIRYLLTLLEGKQPDKELQEAFDSLEADDEPTSQLDDQQK
jgi:tetratricopeptide (TPR) repeat protein